MVGLPIHFSEATVFDSFPWFITVVIGPLLLGLAFLWAVNRRRTTRRAPTLPPDHPARGGGEAERVKTP
ncbi:MAG TPA: hypothetical protein VIL72_02135 [Beijerinckiaceae bacterium]